MVAAGALVLEGQEVPPGRRAQGVPARLVEASVDPYRDGLTRLD
jgi:acetyltransferase-like isoleucine patch superfamily enzyme